MVQAIPTAPAAAIPMDRRARNASLASIARARDLGLTVTVVVVDRFGALVTALRMDGAPWFTPEVARAKARTAVALQQDSGDLEDWRSTRPALLEQIAVQLGYPPATMPGAIVIRKDGEVIAAVAVSGAHPDQDVDCARVGAAAFD